MQKIHLPARPANEGARRLAWWLLDPTRAQERAVRRVRLAQVGIGMIAVHRMLAGEIIPGETDGWTISRVTGGDVRVGDWRSPVEGGWADCPVPHHAQWRAA